MLIDISAPINTPVFSVIPGVVTNIEDTNVPNKYIEDSFGNYVKIK